jgi:hypothetical protein
VFAQHPKEHLLEVREILVHVVGPLKKIAFENRITPLDFPKAKHVIRRPQITFHGYFVVLFGKNKYRTLYVPLYKKE